METVITMDQPAAVKAFNEPMAINSNAIKPATPLSSIEKSIVHLLIKLRLLYFGLTILKNPARTWKVFKTLIQLRDNVSGGPLKKMYKIDGKYYVSQYKPGWPSKVYDNFIKSEIRRYGSSGTVADKLSFVFFAITRKCPMRCEHCFEWDNLNKKESFTKEDLFKVVDIYQKEGVQQFHFSGGEPMVRLKDLLSVIKYAEKKSECWVLTSGFNCTSENALLLKQAGCKGVVVSIDHYIPEIHNLFRGTANAFDLAVNAVAAARKAGLVTAVTVCATRAFIDGGHLIPYMNFAKELGVQFVQVLEPRSVGHYEGKDVSLQEKHIIELEQVFKLVNHDPAFKDFPTALYHGYYQRRIGCLSGGRSLYVDSAGDVHACPFCHNKSYNIIQLIRSKASKLPIKENKCPMFEKTA